MMIAIPGQWSVLCDEPAAWLPSCLAGPRSVCKRFEKVLGGHNLTLGEKPARKGRATANCSESQAKSDTHNTAGRRGMYRADTLNRNPLGRGVPNQVHNLERAAAPTKVCEWQNIRVKFTIL